MNNSRNRHSVVVLCIMWCYLALSPVATFAQRGAKAIPGGADLGRYPLMDHILSVKEQATLGLRPIVLEQPWTGYNWYGGKERFVFETLPAGTLVLADQNGKPIYKADCGNRLVEPAACPKCESLTAATPAPVSTQMPGQAKRGFLDRLWDFVKDLWRFVGGILLLALALLLIFILLYLLYRLLRYLFRKREEEAAGTARSEARSASIVAPVPTPAPTPAATGGHGTSGEPSSPTPEAGRPPEKIPPQQAKRKFVVCYIGGPDEETKIKSGGCKQVFVEQVQETDGSTTTTIRFS